MTAHISPTDLHVLDAEPRMQDLKLAAALEFGQPYDIRKLIKRNGHELAKYGEVFATVAKTLPNGGRPTEEFWLNEPQSVLICMFSRTDKAAEVRREIIEVFMAWRRGQLPQRAGAGEAQSYSFPLDAGPLQAYALKLDTVRLALRAHGLHAARAMWDALELPPVPGFEPAKSDEAERCLAHLVGHVSSRDGQGEPWRTLGDWINVALDCEPESETRRELKQRGIIVLDEDEGGPGFVLANTHPAVTGLFAGTPWKATYPYVLRRLPGVRPHKRLHYGVLQRRGTYLPADLLSPATPAPGSNVITLRN